MSKSPDPPRRAFKTRRISRPDCGRWAGSLLIIRPMTRQSSIGRSGQIGSRRYRVVDVTEGHLDRILAGKWRFARQHVVARHAERIDIGPRIDRLPLHLLGAHVERRAHGHAALCQMHLIRTEDTRQTEVGHFDFALTGQQDVFRFDVAVNNADLARCPAQRLLAA